MKLLCILISLTLVNVLGVDYNDDAYLEKVFITNQLIAQAEDVLPKIITNIVQADPLTYSFEKIVAMLLVLERGTGTSKEMSTWQDCMQAEIKKVKVSDDKPTTSGSNALLPDNTLSKSKMIRKIMTGKGVKTLKYLCSTVLGTINGAALEELEKQRRVLIGKAVQFLVKGVLEGKNQDFQAINSMCNLIALVRSIQNPFDFIIITKVDGELCTLYDRIGNRIRYQHDGKNNYWKINKDGERGPNLTDLLTEFVRMVIIHDRVSNILENSK